MRKPTPTEIILKNSHKIPMLKGMKDTHICSLFNRASLKTINKNEILFEENITPIETVSIVIYGSFSVSIKGKKVDELKEGDMFGVRNVLYDDGFYLPGTTVAGNSYKNLLISFKINSLYKGPSHLSAYFYRNIATYLAGKLSLGHKNFKLYKGTSINSK